MLRLRRPSIVLCTVLPAMGACQDRPLPTDPSLTPSFSQLPALPVVNSLADPGDGVCDDSECTLREAVAFAGPGATIIFMPGLTAGGPATIGLTAGQLGISKNLTIQGPGADLLTVTRNSETRFRIFETLGSTVTIAGLAITNGSSHFGGGINNSGNLTLSDCVVSENVGSNGVSGEGGGGINSSGSLTIQRCTVTNNNGNIGAVYHAGGTATILNSTIAFNGGLTAGIGTAAGAVLLIDQSTIAENHGRFGGGLWASGPTSISNSLFAGNTVFEPGPVDNCRFAVAPTDGGYNLDDGETCGLTGTGSLQNADPQLSAAGLVNNGGPTATIALDPTSPAIDAIPLGANGCGTPQLTDQRGFARPAGAGCDIGAYESGAVLDRTPPQILSSVNGSLGQNDWYTSDVSVSWMVIDKQSPATGCAPRSVTTDTPGQIVTCTATSAGGSTTASVTIKRDATPPSLSPSVSPNPVLLNGSATATPNASDDESGLASSSCDPVVTATPGSLNTKCTATDNAGNQNVVSAGYTVAYGFTGFAQPVSGGGVLNEARAGRGIPLKWRLIDANGDPVTTLTAVSLSVTSLACGEGVTIDLAGELAQGKSGLQNLGDGNYQYNWSTPASYANSCKTLHLDLGDGNPQTALFKFTR